MHFCKICKYMCSLGVCQQVYLLHLPQTRSYVFYDFSRCHGVVCGLRLWYFLIILTYYFCTRPIGCEAQLHQTIRHVCYSSTRPAVMSLLVAYNQHACLLQFHRISIHECYICTQPSTMSVTIASDHLSRL